MVSEPAAKIQDDQIDDTSVIDININDLKSKFIDVIDSHRSNASVPFKRNFENVDTILKQSSFDKDTLQESRAHAFFRIIGLPVVATDGTFYSPGFNPKLGDSQLEKNNNIAQRIPDSVIKMQTERETNIIKKLKMFQSQELDAVVRALVLGASNKVAASPVGGVKPFLNIDPNKGPFDYDKQFFKLPNRKPFIEENYVSVKQDPSGALTAQPIVNFFEEGVHILRPFCTNANIADSVQPSSKMIGAPFLDDEDLQYDKFSLTRPLIELVLRLRLKQNAGQSAKNNEAFIRAGVLGSEINQRLVGQALTGNLSVNQTVTDTIFDNRSVVEITTINSSIRTIKGLIDYVKSAFEKIEDVRQKISYVPLPSKIGPEGGCSLTNYLIQKTKPELEQRIISLQALSSLSVTLDDISSDPSLTVDKFVMGSIIAPNKTFENQLTELTSQRNDYQSDASNALAAIELIIGEISGLGLIDILAIYTTLWSMKLSSLLALIDDNAFERLRIIPELNTVEVLNRANGNGESVIDGLREFEKNLINILSFCDKLFVQSLSSSSRGGGTRG